MEESTKKKLSYEELENVCHQLSEQSRQLYSKIQQLDMSNLFKRLDYLFQVVKYSDKFPKEFVESCVNEIVAGITVPDKEDTSATGEEK